MQPLPQAITEPQKTPAPSSTECGPDGLKRGPYTGPELQRIRALWNKGMGMAEIGRTVRRTPKSIAYVVDAYDMRTKPAKRGRPVVTSPRCSPVVRKLVEIAADEGMGYEAVCIRAGVAKDALARWRRGEQFPLLSSAEAVAGAMGWKIIVVRERV